MQKKIDSMDSAKRKFQEIKKDVALGLKKMKISIDRLNKAEKIAKDATSELKELDIVKPESIENISKLIKLLTEQ